MSHSPTPDTPATSDEIVAKRIVDRLVVAGLLPPRYAEYTQQRLVAGEIKADSWRRLAEKVLDLGHAGVDHGQ